MADINYFSGIVKVLEKPKEIILTNKSSITIVRVEVSQIRTNKLIVLNFWGKLAKDIKLCYQKDDYMIIEGYLFVRNKMIHNTILKTQRQAQLTVLKVYPFSFKIK